MQMFSFVVLRFQFNTGTKIIPQAYRRGWAIRRRKKLFLFHDRKVASSDNELAYDIKSEITDQRS
jgi:hypothetical protein